MAFFLARSKPKSSFMKLYCTAKFCFLLFLFFKKRESHILSRRHWTEAIHIRVTIRDLGLFPSGWITAQRMGWCETKFVSFV